MGDSRGVDGAGGGGEGGGEVPGARRAPRRNALDQPIGEALPDWQPARLPERVPIPGDRCRLEPLAADRHADDLYAAHAEDRTGRGWTYLSYGPFASPQEFRVWVSAMASDPELWPFAIVEATRGRAVGVASYLRAAPTTGSIEIGHLRYSPALQRTPAATEAMVLMMRRVFEEWGYRRYEWKCDALNEPSRKAAVRLGFRYEGTFRHHLVTKGRNRDTAWLSIVAEEWPGLRRAFEAWLAPGNFDAAGRQKTRLRDWMPASAGAPLVVDV